MAATTKSLEELCSQRLPPKTLYVAQYEGDEWREFKPRELYDPYKCNRVHTIWFEDGTIWDAYNGWREPIPVTIDYRAMAGE